MVIVITCGGISSSLDYLNSLSGCDRFIFLNVNIMQVDVYVVFH